MYEKRSSEKLEKNCGELFDVIRLLNRLIFSEASGAENVEGWRRYFLPIDELSAGMPVPFLGIMALIWQLRPSDLQKIYPLNSIESRLDFLAWCVLHGRGEYKALRDNKIWWNALRERARFPEISQDRADAANVFTWEMILIARMRSDLGFDISTSEGRNKFLVWFILHGARECCSDDWAFADWQRKYLDDRSSCYTLSNLEEIVYFSRDDVAAAFPLPGELSNFKKWADSAPEFKLPELQVDVEHDSGKTESCEFGANVIGYAFGQLGIGEDSRMAAASLDSVEIPTVMINFSPGNNIGQDEKSMAKFVSETPRYNTNIYCLTAIEHARYFAETGIKIISSGYNIGYWPWELNEWPEEWEHLFSLVDEVWVSSRHTFDAMAPVANTPVYIMPMAVEIPPPSEMSRADFSLPDNSYLYLFSFDINSSVYRKNPMACIAAFLKAFPKESGENVSLVIKVQKPKRYSSEYNSLIELQADDPRIFLVERTLSKPDLLALYKSCNAFISLHRAEGFGRNIAEAMLLGRPVIVTGYSGNLMFNSIENSFLVKSRLFPVQDGHYDNSTGMVWADADVAHASMRMKYVFEKTEETAALANRGKNFVMRHHNLKVVGQRYAARLASIHSR